MSDGDGETSAGPRCPVCAYVTQRAWLSVIVTVLVSAGAYAFAMPPWGLWPLAFVALVPLLLRTTNATRRAAASTAYGFGLVTFLFLLSWLRYVTIVGWVALACYLAAYPLLFVLLVRWIRRRLGLPLVLLAPILWVALEYVRAVLLSGFPWFLIGHASSRFLPLMQMADLTGVYGISFVIVMVNGLAVDIVRRDPRWRRHAIVAAIVVVGVLAYGWVRIGQYQSEPGPTMALVQGNIPMDLKHSSAPEDAFRVLEQHLRLSLLPETQGVDLLVWPETMMPAALNLPFDPIFPRLELKPYLQRLFSESLAAVKQMARHTGGHLLIGAAALDFDVRGDAVPYNSVLHFDPSGNYLGRYDKLHLVAFGEYTPLRDVFPFLTRLRPAQMGPDLRHGANYRLFDLPWQAAGRRLKFATTICYEDTEPRVVRRLARRGADFLVNVSNDAWFKGSVELEQHLAIGRFRCVENRLGMARAYNSGISAFVDPLGRVTALLQVNGKRREVEGVLVGRVELARQPAGSLYRAIGDVFAYACLALTIGGVLVALLRRLPQASDEPQKPSRRGRPA